MSEYPEHDKQKQVIDSGEAETVQAFLDWLLDDQHVVLAAWDNRERLQPLGTRREQIMADHFGIDLEKIEAERVSMLSKQRNLNLATGAGR